ncbi:MAG: UDP-glucose 4-epimerase [Rhodospirillaceae bacterium TMED8]|nr:UDP-glucose 4-epimerase [Magnetovibrio sp.]OUT51277.1 MAG: UDP-glucose 4-epimerase [Rhodospirillaceae bacterium TMED8]|tara:strand:- start:676 stop:1677 length:1002 start_codon:yes stop_codon:yes gene_type:complete
MTNKNWHVLVTGGAGYVGSALVPKLIEAGHKVTVLDLYLYGDNVFADLHDNPNLKQIRGDLRDKQEVVKALEGCNAVIHLACISNDPSYDLNPKLAKSINFDAFRPLVLAAKSVGVERFVYASSSSVYGIKRNPEVTEDLPLEPLTDYSKYKALCETILQEEREPGFVTITIRPSTVCGYAPRLRLDLTVNILTNHAINNGKITVFGGKQKRPNIHINDMVNLYLHVMTLPDIQIDGQIFNAGWENFEVGEIAEMVKNVLGRSVKIETTPSDDNRSYHISSEKMQRELGFVPTHTIEDAVRDLEAAFTAGKVPNPMDDPRYFNIRLMQKVDLK